MHPDDVIDRALQQFAAGSPTDAVSRETGVAARTLRRWRAEGRPRGRAPQRPVSAAPSRSEWFPPSPPIYVYLLGLYLGDGYINPPRYSRCLQLYLDARQPAIAAECTHALRATFPGTRVARYVRPGTESLRLSVLNPLVDLAFPQQGAGKKHEREILLVDWQQTACRRHPRALLRGMIHSDGCRTENRFKTLLPSGRIAEYFYPRYFFSNLSADIRRIFCEPCELLGIHWTRSNPRNISISRRAGVELLDSFVGPKK